MKKSLIHGTTRRLLALLFAFALLPGVSMAEEAWPNQVPAIAETYPGGERARLRSLTDADTALAYAREFLSSAFVREEGATALTVEPQEEGRWRVTGTGTDGVSTFTLLFTAEGVITSFLNSGPMNALEITQPATPYTITDANFSLLEFINSFAWRMLPCVTFEVSRIEGDWCNANGRFITMTTDNIHTVYAQRFAVQVSPAARVVEFELLKEESLSLDPASQSPAGLMTEQTASSLPAVDDMPLCVYLETPGLNDAEADRLARKVLAEHFQLESAPLEAFSAYQLIQMDEYGQSSAFWQFDADVDGASYSAIVTPNGGNAVVLALRRGTSTLSAYIGALEGKLGAVEDWPLDNLEELSLRWPYLKALYYGEEGSRDELNLFEMTLKALLSASPSLLPGQNQPISPATPMPTAVPTPAPEELDKTSAIDLAKKALIAEYGLEADAVSRYVQLAPEYHLFTDSLNWYGLTPGQNYWYVAFRMPETPVEMLCDYSVILNAATGEVLQTRGPDNIGNG